MFRKLALILAFCMMINVCVTPQSSAASTSERVTVKGVSMVMTGSDIAPTATPFTTITGPAIEPTATPPSSVTGPAVEPTPVPKEIVSIKVQDTEKRVPYASKFTVANVKILVTYDDNSTELLQPEKISEVDTKTLGKQILTVEYKGHTTTYEITIVPRKVSNIRMQEGTFTSMTIAWDILEEAARYEIYTSKTKDGIYTFIGSTDKTEHTFEDMESGKIIYVKIRATSGAYEGDYSEIIPIAPKPEKVTGVKAVKNVKTKITLQWEKAAGATGYAIYYRKSTSSEYVLGGTTTDLSYQVTGLTAGKDYYFIVYAFAADITNLGEGSDEALYGTAPKLPVLSKVKGGDKRIKVYWSKGDGAQVFRIYISTKKSSGYKLAANVPADEYKNRGVGGLIQKKKYYVKVQAVRVVSGMELASMSSVGNATTGKAKATSTKAKYYKTKKKFKKSAAYKKYKTFRQKLNYKKSFIMPGLTVTNIGGFNATRMVPQGITFAGNYLLISAYDYHKKHESVIYIMDKVTRKYITTLVLPHKGHIGGLTCDGYNVWLTYGKKVYALKYSVVQAAALSKQPYVEIYKYAAKCAVQDTASYVAYYKGKLWVGTYHEKVKKYMYGYTVNNINGAPSLTKTNHMLMPNRTQGVAFTSGGKMIISRSCQTKKGRSGFMSRLDVYKPTWNLAVASVKKKSKKKTVQMPPMNEGIAISGSYTYVIYESAAFSECQAPLDRIMAFKTSKIS